MTERTGVLAAVDAVTGFTVIVVLATRVGVVRSSANAHR